MKFINSNNGLPFFYFAVYMVWLMAAGCLLWWMGKADSFLLLNRFHTATADQFFRYFTHLGDGWTAVILSLFIFFIAGKRRLGFVLLLSYSITGIIAQLIKPLVASPRPWSYFQPKHLSFFMDDIIHHGNNSFPSGHTVTAFAMATVLAVFTVQKQVQLLLLLLAALTGFSRVYLSQHFLTDVLAGSLLGVLGAAGCLYLCRNISDEHLAFWKKKKEQ